MAKTDIAISYHFLEPKYPVDGYLAPISSIKMLIYYDEH